MKKRKNIARRGKTKINRKRKIVKKVTKKITRKIIKKPVERTNRQEIGKVFTFYPNIGVAAIKVIDKIRLGDKILIKGDKTNFEQKVESMQIEHKPVKEAKKGDDIGIKVIDKVRQNDMVYRV